MLSKMLKIIDEYVKSIKKYHTPIALTTCKIEKASNADKELRKPKKSRIVE